LVLRLILWLVLPVFEDLLERFDIDFKFANFQTLFDVEGDFGLNRLAHLGLDLALLLLLIGDAEIGFHAATLGVDAGLFNLALRFDALHLLRLLGQLLASVLPNIRQIMLGLTT
jgi:hypothetical protein